MPYCIYHVSFFLLLFFCLCYNLKLGHDEVFFGIVLFCNLCSICIFIQFRYVFSQILPSI